MHIQLGMIDQNNVFSPISFQPHLSRLKPPRKDKLPDIFSDTQFHLSYLLSCHLVDFLNLFVFWLHWVFIAACGLSLLVASCGAGRLSAVASLAVEHGL